MQEGYMHEPQTHTVEEMGLEEQKKIQVFEQ